MRSLLAFLFGVVAVVSILPVVLLDSLNTASLLRERAQDQQILAARRTADRIEAYLDALQAWGRDFSNRPALRTWLEKGADARRPGRHDWEGEILAPFRTRWRLQATFVANPGGTVLLASGTPTFPGPLPGWSAFDRARSGLDAISDVYASFPGGERYLAVLVPIRARASNRVVAIVGAVDSLANLRRIVGQDVGAVGPGSYGVLLDRDSVRLIHGTKPALEGVAVERGGAANGSGASGDLAARIRELSDNPDANPLVRHKLAATGEWSHGAVVALASRPWYYAINTPDSYFYSPIYRQLGRNLLILLGALGLAGALSWTLARWLSGPILRLREAAAAVEGGDLSRRAPVGGSLELADLAASFNRMAERLQRHAADLEEQVRLRTAQLGAIVANAPVTLFSLDAAGIFRFLEGRQPEAIGLDPHATVGRSVEQVYAARPEIAREFRRAIEGQATWAIVEFAGAAFEVRFSPVRREPGEPFGTLIGVATDVTDRKRLEDELKEQYEKLKELDRLKSQFINAVSHDLRTPLTSVRGYAEFLEDEVGGPLGPDQKHFVEQIQLAILRLERLVDDLLDFARIEAGMFRLSVTQADLGAKVVEIVESMRPQAEQVGVALHVADAGPLPEVRMDAQRIGQVLTNFLTNAIKFTPRGGRVEVRLRREDGSVVCEVRDSGIGIAAEDLPKLFRRFSQLAEGQARGGTGLGLAISKAIVEAHGGCTGVRSEIGAGSTFWFALPEQVPAESTTGFATSPG
ncbi:MAG: HAMP domain-containing protein [Candidatus Sericytochromatia bacterium]|nr:HAMP domain-containing protein [Candidatus Tanganyikabacteria bacterium]